MANKPRSILVRSTNWIGDVVMSLPALRELRRLNPSSHLVVLAREWVSGLYQSQPDLADDLLTFPDRRSSLRVIGRIRGFDQAVLLQNAFEAALLCFLARIPDRRGYSTDGRGILLTDRATPRYGVNPRHQVYYYLDLLYLTGLSPIDYRTAAGFVPDIRIRPDATALQWADNFLGEVPGAHRRPLVGLNPGATFGPAKRWTADRYAALADRLIRETGGTVVIVGSKGETAIAEEIRREMKEVPVTAAGRTTIPQLLALLSRCSAFVTNDSGPMHLAAALDLPQVAIFGSTDEVATGPFSPKATVIHKHVECSPCLRKECPIDLRCFTRISVDEVFAAVMQKLEECGNA